MFILYLNIYIQVKSQNGKLRDQLKEKETYQKALQQQVSKAEEKYSDLNLKYENLKMVSNAKEVEDQFSRTQRKMADVKSAFGCINAIKIKYTEEVITMYIKCRGVRLSKCDYIYLHILDN